VGSKVHGGGEVMEGIECLLEDVLVEVAGVKGMLIFLMSDYSDGENKVELVESCLESLERAMRLLRVLKWVWEREGCNSVE